VFKIEVAKSGRSKCKKSKELIPKGELRIGKEVKNPFKEDQMMTAWYKVEPFFEMQLRARKTTEKAESTDDFQGFDELSEEQKEIVSNALNNYMTEKDKPKPKKKRKAKAEGGVKVEKKKKAKKEKTPEKASVKEEQKDLFAGVSPTCPPKEAAAMLLKVARELGFHRLEDDLEAKVRCGQMLMGNKDEKGFDFMKALKALGAELRCEEKIPGAVVKKRKSKPAPTAEVEGNQGIVECFWELAGFEFKDKQDTMKGIAFQKVARGVAALDYKVDSGKEISKKGPKKVPGVGKKSGGMIDEFLETGQIELLEKYKKGDFS